MDSIIAGQKIARRRRTQEKRGGGKSASILGQAPSGAAGRRSRSAIRPGTSAVPRQAPLPPAPKGPPRKIRLGRIQAASLARAARKAAERLAGRLASLGPARATALALSTVLLALVLFTAGAAILRGPSFPMPAESLLPEVQASSELLLEYASPELAGAKTAYADAAQELPPPPATLSYSTYTVRSGDTLGGIAKRFGLTVDSLISANGISSARAVKSGTALRVPSMDGLVHRVRSGESISTISKKYRIEATTLVDANDLGSATLSPGQSLFIPGAKLADADLKQVLGEMIIWPARGRLSSYFGYRPDPFTGIRRFHAGLDIVINSSTPVRAAAGGIVSDVGYNANFGNYIILSHSGGLQTLYGHLSSSAVAKGAKVAQGTMIGLSGNTGYSTGPHLHFGVFKSGVGVNPLKYLK
jgi:murein DD-endopeptidase MepM/ murein hydrolase activator NlpD